MTRAMTEAFAEMLAALKQCTSRADADLKKLSGRTDECKRDYDQCMAAIKKAERAMENLLFAPTTSKEMDFAARKQLKHGEKQQK